MVEKSRSFGPSLEAPGEARRFVADTLQGVTPPEVTNDAQVVVTELAANAVIHAATEFTVDIRGTAERVELTVTDGSRYLPTIQRRREGLGGWGLRLVDQISSAWGTKDTEEGKSVWAQLAEDRTLKPRHRGDPPDDRPPANRE